MSGLSDVGDPGALPDCCDDGGWSAGSEDCGTLLCGAKVVAVHDASQHMMHLSAMPGSLRHHACITALARG